MTASLFRGYANEEKRPTRGAGKSTKGRGRLRLETRDDPTSTSTRCWMCRWEMRGEGVAEGWFVASRKLRRTRACANPPVFKDASRCVVHFRWNYAKGTVRDGDNG